MSNRSWEGLEQQDILFLLKILRFRRPVPVRIRRNAYAFTANLGAVLVSHYGCAGPGTAEASGNNNEAIEPLLWGSRDEHPTLGGRGRH